MILVECYADERLIRTLLPELSKREYSHAGNKTGVIKRLIRTRNGKKCIGLVDRDPHTNPPGFFHYFTLLENLEELKISIYFYRENNAKLVVIEPELEGWIISIAHSIHLKLKDYSLPEDPDKLHEVINEKRNLDNFSRLVSDLLHRSDHLSRLKEILSRGID